MALIKISLQFVFEAEIKVAGISAKFQGRKCVEQLFD